MYSYTEWIIPSLWWSWAAYWFVSSFGNRPAKRVLSGAGRTILVVEVVLSVWLVSAHGFHGGWLGARILPLSLAWFWAGAAITAAGLGFSVWARVHLGEYWSGNVTLKEGHRLIRSGPYALVRHPIYTGILLGMLGTAVAVGEVRGVLAVAILTFSFIRKLRKEEEWLTEEFGEEYLRYKREVRALL
ncbi:MAG TPA: isoprenylcysteine carboxylmethyltransferase family protein [Opitutaceae bacterium]|nr:isoprenylcysteine carboxylmethyltransferase family protein [Opitutaceae bacterium]